MKTTKILLILTLLIGLSIGSNAQVNLDSIPDGSSYTYIASPIGSGPFPAVLYNHGGLDTVVGGDIRGTTIALAQAGFFARGEKRQETASITGHLTEVLNALDSLRADPRADTNCVGIMGFSRGGLLTLQACSLAYNKVNAVISMAPANAANQLNTLVQNVALIDDPVLLLVTNNDTFQGTHVLWAQMVHDSLISAGKTSNIIVYPDYDEDGNMIINANDDGHELFSIVQPPYWQDAINFLTNYICGVTAINQLADKTTIINIYPNPSTKRITIEFKETKSNLNLSLINALGQVILTKNYKSTDYINLDLDAPKGVYLLQLETSGEVITKKVIKE